MQIVYMTSGFRSSLYRAIVAIVLGVVLVVWPDVAMQYIIMFIGGMFLVTGLLAFILSNRNHEEHRRSLVPFSGIGSMALGVLLLAYPDFFTTIFMFILAFILILAAVGQFVSLAAARRFGVVSPLSYLYATLILIAGIVVMFNPFTTAEGVFILFGITAIFYGITDLLNQRTIRKIRKVKDRREQIQREEHADNIEDVEYEEIK